MGRKRDKSRDRPTLEGRVEGSVNIVGSLLYIQLANTAGYGVPSSNKDFRRVTFGRLGCIRSKNEVKWVSFMVLIGVAVIVLFDLNTESSL